MKQFEWLVITLHVFFNYFAWNDWCHRCILKLPYTVSMSLLRHWTCHCQVISGTAGKAFAATVSPCYTNHLLYMTSGHPRQVVAKSR